MSTERPLASSYIAESSNVQQVTSPVVATSQGTRDSGINLRGSFVHDTFMRSSNHFSPNKTSQVQTTTVPATYTTTTYTTAAYTSAVPTTTYTATADHHTEALKRSTPGSYLDNVHAGGYTSYITSAAGPATASYITNVAGLNSSHHGLGNISVTSESVYRPSSSFETHNISPQRESEIIKRATITTTRVSESPARISEARQSLLTPYRQTMYPEFNLVEDLPERRNLIDSINGLLTKSTGRETLLVSPNRLSIKRESLLSPAEIELESLFKEKAEDGSVYEGQARDGVRHGKGRITYSDGSIFEGQFENGNATGNGILRYKTGKVAYEGAWNGAQYEGQGVLQSEAPIPFHGAFDHKNLDKVENHWIRYEGEFRGGKRHGQGTLVLSNGEKFVGEFNDDQINGKGTYHLLNGQTVEGQWENGVWRD